MPARSIVILDQQTVKAQTIYRYLLRADVPSTRQVKFAQPGYVSPFVPMAPDTDPDASALVNGAVVEDLRIWTLDPSVSLATIKAELLQQQTDYQAAVTADPTYSRYGTYYDPLQSKWVAQGG